MNQWALLLNGKIVSIITTDRNIENVRNRNPGYEVVDLYSLLSDVQQAYPFWDERP